ncbi:MAG TPA: serine hydrolase domain-containing protein [Pyrinomonadaceae bacterium]|jgi:CubicO group peptidase (beta-lactamase class C family)
MAAMWLVKIIAETFLPLILFFVLFPADRVPAQSDKDSGPQKSIVKGETGAKLDRLLTRYAMYGFSGTVLAAKNGKIILNRGYGLADREHNLPNTTETVFAIGSLTKQFTAAAILQLEAQGKLNTQDFAGKYLGEFPRDKAGITLHHLLTHTSGLISDGANAQLPLENRDEYVEAVKKTRLRSTPGEKFNYSNVGYNLLAAIVEKVSGISFEDYLQQRLFRPAGMKSTGFINKRQWDASLMSVGYEPAAIGAGSVSRVETAKPSKWDDKGAGGVLTTTGDLYKWYRALEGTRILSAAGRKRLYTPFLSDYAYGWEVRKTKQGTPAIQHGGDVPGFQSWFAQFPEEKLVIIMLINNRMRWRSLLTNTLASAAFGEAYETPPPLMSMEAAALEHYAGVYGLATGGQLHAWVSNGAFFIGAEGQDAVNLLTHASEKDAALYGELNTRVAGIIEKFRRGDFALLQEFSGTAKPSEYAASFQQWWEDFVRNNGAVKAHRILGTARSRTGHAVTFVRVEYEKATKVLRLLWFNDKMVGHGTGVSRPAIAQFLPETPTQFTSFDILTSQLTGVSFRLKENGIAESLTVPSKEGKVVAQRIE